MISSWALSSKICVSLRKIIRRLPSLFGQFSQSCVTRRCKFWQILFPDVLVSVQAMDPCNWFYKNTELIWQTFTTPMQVSCWALNHSYSSAGCTTTSSTLVVHLLTPQVVLTSAGFEFRAEKWNKYHKVYSLMLQWLQVCFLQRYNHTFIGRLHFTLIFNNWCLTYSRNIGIDKRTLVGFELLS